jgi:3-O-methylgallate 3,4-dioxygenase
MAQIVVGVAASHTPQLSSGVDMWQDHGERDRKNPKLLGKDGEYHSFDDLVEMADPKVAGELTQEIWEEKYRRAQEGIDELTRQLQEARADVAVVIGDDQWELFQDEGVPTFAFCVGSELYDVPKSKEELAKLAKGIRAAQWAAHGDTRSRHIVDGELGAHLVEHLAVADFDVTRFSKQGPDKTLGHAFTFPRYRLGLSPETPIAPIFINTYYPPNVPTARRCYALGREVARAIESWESDARVAVITSGGLSHFVIDEELDRAVLAGLSARGPDAFDFLTRNQMRSGNSEILNWVTAAGVLENLSAKTVDYVPGYRSAAGTGTGMAFAYWT